MNNRFKFRVFDKETGKYYKTRTSKGSGCIVYQHPASSHYAWIQIGTLFAELEQDEKTYAQTGLEPDFIIEQCTGLKDKNGKLIYEGDVVEITIFGSVGANGGYVDSDEIYKGTVVWERDCFLVKTKADDMILFPHSEDNIEIIGNIHEQAEQKESAFVHNKIEFPEYNDNLLEEFDKQFFENGQDDDLTETALEQKD